MVDQEIKKDKVKEETRDFSASLKKFDKKECLSKFKSKIRNLPRPVVFSLLVLGLIMFAAILFAFLGGNILSFTNHSCYVEQSKNAISGTNEFDVVCPSSDLGWKQVSEDPEVWRDKTTGLYWANTLDERRSWEDSVANCDALDWEGMDSWYLPTKDELMQAYENGIVQEAAMEMTREGTPTYFWTLTEREDYTTSAWIVHLTNGSVNNTSKLYETNAYCVARK